MRARKLIAVALMLTITVVLLGSLPLRSYASNSAQEDTETALITKYGTYKGKNATRIPVITYHMVVTDAQKRNNYRGSLWLYQRALLTNKCGG